MKKIISAMLALILLLSLSLTSFAEDKVLTYDLSCDGSALSNGTNEVVLNTGDTITVYYKVAADSSTTISVMQNEIYYDDTFFEFVDGSNKVEADFGEFKTSHTKRLSGMHVYYNCISDYSFDTTPSQIGSFKLKIIAQSGESTIANKNVMAFVLGASASETINVQNLHVSVNKPQVQKFSVSFTSEGEAVDSISVEAGESITLPESKMKNYAFAYWTVSGSSVQYKAGTSFTPESDTVFFAVFVKLEKPAAPANLTAAAPSSADKADGRIIGTTSDMEYSTSADFSDAKTCADDETTGLASGVYYVRYKENGTAPAGEHIAIVIEKGAANNQENTDNPETQKPETSRKCSISDNCPLADFVDADANQWYHNGIHYCVANGIMNGYGNGRFGTTDNTSRAQVVTMLYRLEGSPVVTGNNTFVDVESGAYYEKPVIWASENKIVGGYGDGVFAPNDNITREQLAAIMYRYAKYKGIDVSAAISVDGYLDRADVHEYALDAIKWVCAVGVINGTSDTTLSPLDNATRAQIATVFQRYCENIIK